jgi:RNA polymerase sigma-70 factor (ECF subfamily)
MYRRGGKSAPVDDQSGEGPAAFRRIVDENRSRVFHTAYGILQNDEDAKDITQDVFLKVYEKLETFKGDAKLYTWIYRITVNTCLDVLKKRKKEKGLPFREEIGAKAQDVGRALASTPDSPFEAVYHAELKAKIQEAFLRLSPEHRVALVLREIEGLSYQEIAETLSCSVGTVMSRLHYARKKMQKLLTSVWGKDVP